MANPAYTYTYGPVEIGAGVPVASTGTSSGSFTVTYNDDGTSGIASGSISYDTPDTGPITDNFTELTVNGSGVINYHDPNGSILTITYNGEDASNFIEYQIQTPQGDVYSATSEVPVMTTVASAPCFASGTAINVMSGRANVEHLIIGDVVVTASGAHRPIKWIGHRTVVFERQPGRSDDMPIRILAHAFGKDRPCRDLLVSPGHSICVDVLGEVLIPASSLLNGSTVRRDEVDEVTYWHIELDSHDIILAENLPSESYLDMGNRGFFREADVVDLAATPDPSRRTHADFCRPFHASGPLVEVVRAQLRKRAEAAGWQLSSAIEMHLEVDGKRLDPVVRGLTARFQVPAEAKDMWLIAPTARPSDLGASGDNRDLGLCLGALRLDDGFEVRDVALDDPSLGTGFHEVEDGRRWTSARARLPAALWDGCEGSFFLRVELAGLPVPRWTAPASETVATERPLLAIVA